jgi:hypothetical protein
MIVRDVHLSAATHLNDLQADIEAGSRSIEFVHRSAVRLHRTLAAENAEQAALLAALVGQMHDLRGCIRQQLDLLRELRRDIRLLRAEMQKAMRRD